MSRTDSAEWKYLRKAVLYAAGPEPLCWRCGRTIVGEVHVGHLVDHALGGLDEFDNLAPEHPDCSRRAGARLAAERRAERRRAPRSRVVTAPPGTLFTNPV